MFKNLPGILQNILGDIPQVEIELSTTMIRHLGKGIHHPEFNKLHIGLFKITGVNLSHDSSPAIFGSQQFTFLSDSFEIIIVGPSFLRVESHIQYRNSGGDPVWIFLEWKNILLIHLVYVGTGHEIRIVLHIVGSP